MRLKEQILIFILVGLTGCINFKSKKDHKYSIELCKLETKTCNCKLYIEGYTISRAFGSTDINSEYLTDSNSFRLYMGNYDESDERLKYKCEGDTIYYEKRTNKDFGENWDTFRILEKKYFILNDLKKIKKFD